MAAWVVAGVFVAGCVWFCLSYYHEECEHNKPYDYNGIFLAILTGVPFLVIVVVNISGLISKQEKKRKVSENN